MLGYDWHETMTAEKAVLELEDDKGNPFNFRGPGWYMENDVLLIVENPNKGFFDFYCWNTPNFDPRDHLLGIVALPKFSEQGYPVKG